MKVEYKKGTNMKLAKTASGKQTIKMSKWEWKVIGMKLGVIPTLCSEAKKAQNKFTKTSQVNNDIDAGKVRDTLASSISFSYPNSFLLKTQNGEEIENLTDVENAILKAFMFIYERDRDFKSKVNAYIKAGRDFKLGVFYTKEGNKNYLVPSFDGFGLTNIKSEFTSMIPYAINPPKKERSVSFGDVDIKGISNIEELLLMVNAAGFVVANGRVDIGSIGVRKTNWDTAYNFHISGVPAPVLKQILTWFTDISNKDIRNLVMTNTKETFDLTQVKEVHALMSRLGLSKEFISAVKEIKDWEDKKGLKVKHKLRGHIDDKKDIKATSISLDQYREKVFTSLREHASNNPAYVEMMTNAGITNPEEAFDVAFSEGLNGQLMSASEAKDLVSLAA